MWGAGKQTDEQGAGSPTWSMIVLSLGCFSNPTSPCFQEGASLDKESLFSIINGKKCSVDYLEIITLSFTI